MKPLPLDVLAALARRFDADPRRLELLGGGQDYSDGTVFTFAAAGEPRVLKVLGPFSDGDGALRAAEARVDAVALLSAGGDALVRPLPSRAGERFEVAAAGGQVFLAYAYPFAPGRRAGAGDAAVRSGAYGRALGAAVGRLHAAWEAVPEVLSPEGTSDRTGALGGWREEWGFFRTWCRDDEVGCAWERIRAVLDRLPVDKRGYGFVHNDVHPGNALLEPAAAARGDAEPALRLIDFDVAGYHWFVNDAAAAVYGLGSLEAGGLETPRGPTDVALASAGDRFWEGYRRHREPGAAWLERLPLFLQYRRCLLFMPFQELTAADPAWRASWKGRIAEADARLFG